MVGARIQYWSCLPPAQSRVAVSEARIDFLTLWAPSDGYVWKDFSQNLRRPIAARWRASSGGWGVGQGSSLRSCRANNKSSRVMSIALE
jgi:hypothetical protein